MRDPHSSSQGPNDGDEPIRWWKPGWRDVVAQKGFAWVLLAVAGVVIVAPFSIIMLIGGLPFLAVSFKVIFMLIGTAIALVAYLVRHAINARREPFCIFCGYNLTGLPDDYRCPECGRAYTWAQIEQYRQDPQWFIERWKARQSLPPADRPLDTGPPRPSRRSRDGT